MEGDTGHQDADLSQHGNELKLVNIDTSGEQASSPTCPLNLLVRSPLTGKVELELSDPFLIGSSRLSGGGSGVGGGGDRPVPTDELVDFREKGSREADGSGRAEDDLELIGDDALEQLSGEADMDNIFQEALALADQFSQLDKLDDADVSLVDSAPQSLPGDSELLSLDAGLLASLAEARRQLPPPSARSRPADDLSATVSPLDSSFPAPSGGLGGMGVSTLRSASAAAVAQVAAKTASGLTPPPGVAGVPLRSASAAAVVSRASPAEVPASRVAPRARAPPAPAPVVPAVGDEEDPVPEFSAVDSTDQDSVFVVPAAPAPAPAASRLAASSRLAGRQRDSLAMTAGRRLVAPCAAATAPAASASAPAASVPAAPVAPAATPDAAPSPPSAAEDAPTYAELCEQASAEQRELELQADEEYENRQFEQLERRVSREDVLDVDSADSESAPAAETDSTDAGRRPGHPRSQLSRKETYICRPNTGTFKIDKRQRFGTFKVDKTGTFKVPRASAAAARSLPPEPPPPPGDVNGNQPGPVDDGIAGDTPGSDVNGADVHSDSMNNTYFRGGDRYEERSPSPPRGLLSAGTPEREDAPPSALGRRAAALRRPLTSTPCRSVGSSGSSIGVTPIRAPPADDVGEDSPVPMPMAALRGPGLRQPQAAPAAAAGLRRPAASGLRQPLASGLRQPAASGLRQPAASGLRQPAASGLRAPSATGLRPPSASGLRAPSASGLRAPSASVSAGAARAVPARQTATQLRQSSAQSGSDSSVCSVRSLPGPNTSRSNPSLVADRSDVEPALSQRQPRQLPGPASRLPGRGGGVRRSLGGTGSLTNISLQAHHSAASGLRRPTTGRLRGQETSKLSLSQQPAGSERF